MKVLAPEFAVGDRLQADVFLHLYGFRDGNIFPLAKTVGRDFPALNSSRAASEIAAAADCQHGRPGTAPWRSS